MESTNRREFLLLSLAAAVNTFAAPLKVYAAPRTAVWPAHAKFQELAPGSIKPEGWLGLNLHKQAASLAISLPDISWPFTAPYWEGEEEAASWWPWEQTAYWIDGASRCALAAGDAKLLQRSMERIRYTLAHPRGSFLGPKALEDPLPSYHRWPHAILFRALSALSDAGIVKGIPDTLSSFYLSDTADYAISARNIANVESMLWCYSRTGNRQLLELAEKSWEGYVTGKPQESADLSREEVYGGGPIKAHGVTYAEIAKLPAILYASTGNPEYLTFALAAQQRIFDHHMLVDGIPSTTEIFRTTTALDSHETCDISDHTWSWGHLLIVTGDGAWADRIERACFNAGMGAVRKDWKGVQYFSCPNQVFATLTSNHNIKHRGNYWMAYQPNPGRETACCGANVHRFLPNYALRMWMKTADQGLAAVLYGASSVQARVGSKQDFVTIEEETTYPFEEEIRFTIRSAKPVEFPLRLRIPGWCSAPQLRINQRKLQMPHTEQGFITISRRFHPGDVISISLPMRLKTSHWPASGVAFERGPLVYSHAVDTRWSSSVLPKWSTEQFPLWTAQPMADWNYGVPEQGIEGTTVPSMPMPPADHDPWETPPVALEITAQKINSWKPTRMDSSEGGELTPDLPTDRSGIASAERIKLVPYGSTELRITVFPQV